MFVITRILGNVSLVMGSVSNNSSPIPIFQCFGYLDRMKKELDSILDFIQ